MSCCTKASLALLLLAVPSLQAQQTTNTSCNSYGNTTNCTSTTTDNPAQQRQMYEAGQQIGAALGNGIALAMQSHAKHHWVKKFCAGHPGESWNWTRTDGVQLDSGRCATDEDKALLAVNQFMSHHRDFVKDQRNSDTIIAYLELHSLDPREQKAYERAYKDLKKESKLELYRR